MLALHPFRVLGGVAATPGFGQFGTEILWPPTTASRINKKSTPEHRVVKPTESEREAPEDEPSRNGGGGGGSALRSSCPRAVQGEVDAPTYIGRGCLLRSRGQMLKE